MSRVSKLMLPFAQWPTEDQNRWEAAFKSGDRFDESGRGAHLAASTSSGTTGKLCPVPGIHLREPPLVAYPST